MIKVLPMSWKNLNRIKYWMIAQNDFLINNKMPLIKPTLHPLDKETEWTNVPDGLKNKIKLSTYMDSHY